MIEPTDLDWLALCLVTESNRPEEWPYIAQVIENRRKSGPWGTTYSGVVLARKQFSAFNDFTSSKESHFHEETIFSAIATRIGNALLLMRAAAFVGTNQPSAALAMAGVHGWAEAISMKTLHYYSPISMKPAGSKPPWAASAKRLYTPAGVDPARFVFAEGVP